MATAERRRRASLTWRFYNSVKVEIGNSLENPPDDFDAQMAVLSRVTYAIYKENQELFSSVRRLYYRLTRRSLAEEEAKPFADFLVEARITPVVPLCPQGSKKNKSGSREKYYVLRSKFDEAEKKLRALCASKKNGGTAV